MPASTESLVQAIPQSGWAPPCRFLASYAGLLPGLLIGLALLQAALQAVGAASCGADDLFSNPHCAEIFRHLNRGAPAPQPLALFPSENKSAPTPSPPPQWDGQQSEQRSAKAQPTAPANQQKPPTRLRWEEVPDTAMNSVFVEGVDNHPYFSEVAAPRSWRTIQSAWSSGVCINGRLFVTGGGHGDGAHNGILSVDGVTGKWRREKEPLIPGPPRGNVEATFNGEPVSKHTYGLLASDGTDLFLLGGAIFQRGNVGDGQVNYRYQVADGKFAPLSDAVRRASGYSIYVDGIIYLVGNKSWGDFWKYHVASDRWENVGEKSVLSGMVSKATVVYEPAHDLFVALGNGHAKSVKREFFGTRWDDLSDGVSAPVLDASYPGVTAHNGYVYLWAGGADIHRLDPTDNSWTTITPSGNGPGGVVGTGTLHRFNSCGGNIILVNGVENNLFKLVPAGTAAAPPGQPKSDSPPSEPNDSPAAPKSRSSASPNPAPPPKPLPDLVGKRTGPYSIPPEPPPRPMPATPWKSVRYEASGLTEDELVAAECTSPIAEWDVYEVRNAADQRKQKRSIGPNDNALIRVHYPGNPDWNGVHDFKQIDVRGSGCVKILGINDPKSGKRPTVRSINGDESNRRRGERYGGLIIENMRISMGDHHDVHGPSGSGDCILWPNAARFAVIRDTEVSKCGHHAFITAHAYQQYLEIDNSHFEYASSHLAYIDRVGFAYIHDSTFQSPGWGHALRCIAARCVIDNVHVSNIELDGTIAPLGINPRQPRRTYIGMNAIDLYMTGGEHVLENSTIDFYNTGKGGAWAAQYRARRAIQSSDLGPHNGEEWLYAPYWTQEWFDAQGVPVKPVDLTVSNNTFNCLNKSCYMFLANSTYPRVTSRTRREIIQWLNENKWSDWDTLMANSPEKWLWTFSRVRNSHKKRFLRGATYGQLPARIPVEPEWIERGILTIKNDNVINNPRKPLIRPETPSRAYCWGFWVEGNEGEECEATIRQVKIIIEE